MARFETRRIISEEDLGYKSLTGADVLQKLSSTPNVKPDSLLLNSNCIDDKGIDIILRSPNINRVYYLDLYSNQIGDSGALAIIQSSKTNNISSLNLSCNRISASGIVALANCLPGSKIVCLDLRFNAGSQCPRAFEALVSAASKHKILQYLQIDSASCKSLLLPVLKNNREYVSQIKRELKELLTSLKHQNELQYPMATLDLSTLKKFEQFFSNKMLFSIVDSTDKPSLVKIQNYINYNFLKITGIVEVSPEGTHCTSLEVLPPEVVSNITRYCKLSDILSEKS